ncbi:MAG: thioredoxin family protein [Bacteroidia bacterium]|nr:thioredoxin family protein [Bacteroidia bacterium]
MRKIFGLILLLSSVVAMGQDVTPADFSIKLDKSEASVGDVVEITFEAAIPSHLHIYANVGDCEVGPKKPWYESLKLTDCEFVGAIRDGYKPHIYQDEIFGCEVSDFSKKADFRQSLKITGPSPSVGGEFWYQICSESMCLDFPYEFTLPALKVTAKAATPETPEQPDKTIDETGGNSGDEQVEDTSSQTSDVDTASSTPVANKDNTSEKTDTEEDSASSKGESKDKSLWGLFLLGVLGGLGAIFTPCVYPMIPMTVAFFTKETDRAKGKKKALFYGLSIIAIYIIFGVVLANVFGKTFSYTLSTHWLPNILFFLIFIIFAMSFLGMFELTLPASFVNKMDQKGDKGGYVGVFFIAFTLVLVSFSCTAPIVGTVALLATDGETIRAVVAMLGFALVFALPFGLFAFFPSMLNSLPQSGGWLNSVKVVLGFLELALAFKFLSQADLAYHWGILDRDVFLSIWIVLSILLGLYLLGKIKFPHDSDLPRIPIPRFLVAVAVFAFGLYLVPGMWGAPLKPLAGFLPPLSTQDYKVLAGGAGHQPSEGTHSGHKYADIIEVANDLGIDQYFDYDEAFEASRELKKPVFVDFTGHTCANCRKMEEYVWPEPPVLNQLKNDYIVLSLYCDEKHELPEDEWITNKDGKVLKSIGRQNLYRLSEQFGEIGQPFYFVLDSDENLLETFSGYDPDYTKFDTFLRNGQEKFKAWLKE